MVKIRLSRGGVKKRPFYSIVVTDRRRRRDSGYIEKIGYFNPFAKDGEIRINIEEKKLIMWQSRGAQLSDRIKSLVKEYKNPAIREKIVAKRKAKIQAKKDQKIAEISAKLNEDNANTKTVEKETEPKVEETQKSTKDNAN